MLIASITGPLDPMSLRRVGCPSNVVSDAHSWFLKIIVIISVVAILLWIADVWEAAKAKAEAKAAADAKAEAEAEVEADAKAEAEAKAAADAKAEAEAKVEAETKAAAEAAAEAANAIKSARLAEQLIADREANLTEAKQYFKDCDLQKTGLTRVDNAIGAQMLNDEKRHTVAKTMGKIEY